MSEATIVVATDGRADAAGTISDPFDLSTALGRDSVRPGSTILLRGGTYRGAFKSTLNGGTDDPIIVRSFPGERAVLEGGRRAESTLTVNGSHTWFQDLEVTKSDPDRSTSEEGSHPAGLIRASANGIDVFGSEIRLIDVVVHDHGNGIGLWRSAQGAEVQGALVFNNGWVGPDRGHGHGIYVQNREGTKQIVDSVVFNNFGYGIHGYADNGYVADVVIRGVTSFGNGSPSGAAYPNIYLGARQNPVDGVSIHSSVLYHRPSAEGGNLELGIARIENGGFALEDSVIAGGSTPATVRSFAEATVRGNTFRSVRDLSYGPRLLVELATAVEGEVGLGDPLTRYEWDDNAYLDVSGTESQQAQPSFLFDAESRDEALTFGSWRHETGLDDTSTYSTRESSSVEVHVRRGHNRAWITTLDPIGHGVAKVDAESAGLEPGDAYEVLDVEDPFGVSVTSGVWERGLIEIPLGTSMKVTQPFGHGFRTPDHTPADFGVFVLLRR